MTLIVRIIKWPIALVDRIGARIGYVCVILYRALVSKHKGFRCASAAVRGKPSCSDVALSALRTKRLTEALADIRTQSRFCRLAARTQVSQLIGDADRNVARLLPVAAMGVAISCFGDSGESDQSSGQTQNNATSATPPPPPPLGD